MSWQVELEQGYRCHYFLWKSFKSINYIQIYTMSTKIDSLTLSSNKSEFMEQNVCNQMT